MNYEITFDGKDYELPQFSFGLNDQMEAIAKYSGGFKEKCKKMYTFCKEVLGKDVVSDVLGNFEKCDPNVIQLLYTKILDAYGMPLFENGVERVSNVIEGSNLDKVSEVMRDLDKLSPISEKK